MACRPAGLSMIQCRSLVSCLSPCSAAFSVRKGVVARSTSGIALAFPEINLGGLGLPHTGLLDAGQAGERAIFRTERHIAVGLRHDRRLAGDAVTEHTEAVLGADHERVEAVEIIEAHFQRIAEREPFAHAPGEIAG